MRNYVVSAEEEKERLQWEGFAEKGFKYGMKERVGDEKLIIISVAVRGINANMLLTLSCKLVKVSAMNCVFFVTKSSPRFRCTL